VKAGFLLALVVMVAVALVQKATQQPQRLELQTLAVEAEAVQTALQIRLEPQAVLVS
jgi:hypothetical protein